MENSFNLLFEPWIDTIDFEGNIQSYGILELLNNAHKLSEICDTSPLMKYGVYRFLIAFVMDAFNISDTDDIDKIFDEKKFSSSVLETYCKSYTNRFYLFSQESPFYQNPKIIDNDEKNIIEIFQFYFPKGNNTILTFHTLQNEYAFSPAICAKALCSLSPFAIIAGRGYSSNINGKTPWYVLIKGKNLFETLTLNCCGTPIDLNTGEQPVSWKLPNIEINSSIQQVSTLQGLTWIPRYIYLCLGNEGICSYSGRQSKILVSKVNFQQGWKFNGAWIDPHVSYILSKTGRYALRPEIGKQLWRDIGPLMVPLTIISENTENKIYQNPIVVQQFHRFSLEKHLSDKYLFTIEVYGLNNDKAKFLECYSEKLTLPIIILKNQYKSKQIQPAIDIANKVEFALKDAIKRFGSKSKGFQNLILNEYWTRLERLFKNWFLKELERQDESDLNAAGKLHTDWRTNLKSTGKDVLELFLSEMESNAELLKIQVMIMDHYLKKVSYLLFPSDKNKAKKKSKNSKEVN